MSETVSQLNRQYIPELWFTVFFRLFYLKKVLVRLETCNCWDISIELFEKK